MKNRFLRAGCTRRSFLASLGAAVAAARPAAARGSDWPQLRGPHRDGVYPGNDVAARLPEDGPAVIWEKPVGAGFANAAAAAGRLVVFHRQGGSEIVEAWDAESAEALWKFDYPTSYRDDFGFDEGPRASPVIAGGQVYTFGAEGMLHCLRLDNGQKIWSADTHRQFDVRKGFFGAASTPLADGSRLFVNAGGKNAGLVAFDKDTGRVLWTATDHEASYSSPVSAEIAGRRSVVAFTREGLVGADPASGEVAFEMRWRSRSNASVNAAMPIVVDDHIFISASYGTGAALVRVTGDGLQTVWSGEGSLDNHYATSVFHKGFLYGYHGRQEYGQALRCVEWLTGKVRWSEERFGAGTVTLAEERLLLVRENGELLMAEASPEAFRPISRAQLLPGTIRAYPALVHGKLYVRDDNTLICIDLQSK